MKWVAVTQHYCCTQWFNAYHETEILFSSADRPFCFSSHLCDPLWLHTLVHLADIFTNINLTDHFNVLLLQSSKHVKKLSPLYAKQSYEGCGLKKMLQTLPTLHGFFD
jgi:hypothetical protein